MMRGFLLGAGCAAMAFLGSATAYAAENNVDTYRQLDLLMEVFERVRAEYVEEVDDEEVLESAINGMLMALDPHSSYLGPDNFRNMQVQTRGEYGGLGLEVVQENGVVKVVSPIDGTPAERAGLKSGDYITQIDGEPVLGKTLDEAVEQMRGPVGAPITITVVRPIEGEEDDVFDVDLVRDNIRLTPVAHRIERDNIGYVRIRTFNEQTTSGVKEAITDIEKEVGDDLMGIVLDLRSNPGGLLDQAISVSDLFLERGEVVSTRGRHARDTKRWHATPGDRVNGKPIVVLVNAGSASASEIVAGALQDHHRATVLGDDTFGKGTVQTIIPLGADSALRLTTARYYTPSGRSIQERGIEPDIAVRQVLKTASGRIIKPRRERDLIGHLEHEENRAEEDVVNEAIATAEDTASEVDDAKSPDTSAAENNADADLNDEAEEDDTPRDHQLEYALDLLQGVRSAVTGQQAAADLND